MENSLPDFDDVMTPYNKLFTFEELQLVLNKCKDTAPGEDGVVYKMIKNMPVSGKNYVLKIFNKFFRDSYFPPQWGCSIIVPIAKPGKNPTSPKSYRPIALTSCLCKTLERLINERMMEFFIMNKVLTTAQSGGQKGRSTVDHLIRLEDTIKTAFANKEHFISIFFDLERAYDMTWRKGIVIDLFNIGLRGLLPKYISAFLETRSFRVNIGNAISPEYVQQNGVPQGAVLSVLLFALKINNIATCLPPQERFSFSLFVDDLQIGF